MLRITAPSLDVIPRVIDAMIDKNTPRSISPDKTVLLRQDKVVKALRKKNKCPGWFIYEHAKFSRIPNKFQNRVEEAYEKGESSAVVGMVTNPSHPVFSGRCALAVRQIMINEPIACYSFGGTVHVDNAKRANADLVDVAVLEINQFIFNSEKINNISPLLIMPDTTRAICAINDPRGFADMRTPNTKFVNIVDSTSGRCDVMLMATRNIEEGEELLAHYGETYWEHSASLLAAWAECCKQADEVVAMGGGCLELGPTGDGFRAASIH